MAKFFTSVDVMESTNAAVSFHNKVINFKHFVNMFELGDFVELKKAAATGTTELSIWQADIFELSMLAKLGFTIDLRRRSLSWANDNIGKKLDFASRLRLISTAANELKHVIEHHVDEITELIIRNTTASIRFEFDEELHDIDLNLIVEQSILGKFKVDINIEKPVSTMSKIATITIRS